MIEPTNSIEEKVMDSAGFPFPVFDTLLPMIQSRAIVAGVRMGVFKAIGKEIRTVEAIAHELSLDSECLELILRVLACAGYVTREGAGYRLSEMTRASLLPDSPVKLSTAVEWNYMTWDAIEKLEEVARTGVGLDAHKNIGPSANWATYQRAMLEMSQTVAREVASLVPIKEGAKKLLDIGGAHGLFGAMICRQHPLLHSEVIDLPEAVEQSRQLAREEKIDDVVTHRAGDVLHEDLGEGYDAAFIGNFIHHFTQTQNRDLLRRVKSALTPGGTVAIWDFIRPDPDADHELCGDAMALFFRIASTSQCYRSADYMDWLESNGFENVAAQAAPFAPSNVLVTGTVPGESETAF